MLGENLRHLREDKDIRQKIVAEHINKSVQAYSQYESNKREPDSETLVKLADFYGVSVDYLLGRTKFKTFDFTMSKNDNLYMLNIGDLSKHSIGKIQEYIEMLRQIEQK